MFSSPPNELDFIGTVRYFVRPSQEDQQDHLQEVYCHPHHQIQSGLLRGVWHSVMRPEEGNGLRKSGLTRTHSASLGLYCAPLPPFCVKNHPTPFHYGLLPQFKHLSLLSFKRRTKCLTLRLNSLRPWSFIGQRLNARILVHEISFKANEDS